MSAPPAPTRTCPNADMAVLAARLDGILGHVLLLVAAKFRILGILTVPLWGRLSRARQRLARQLAALAAGRLPRRRIGAPDPRARQGARPEARIPNGRIWLVARLGYEAAIFGSQIEFALRDPQMLAALTQATAAAPAIARTLRPICRMLGVPLPDCLKPPPRPKRPKPAAPEPAAPESAPPESAPKPPPPSPPAPPATPDRPLPAYVRAAARAWRRKYG